MNTLSRSSILLVLVLGASLALAQVPTITAVSAQSGAAGSSFTITGTNFSTTSANDVVRIGGVAASVTGATSTSLTVKVPTNATGGLVTVTVKTAKLTAYWTTPFTVTFPYTGPIDTSAFASPVGWAAGVSPANTFTGDFDGDGKIDIGVTNNGDNSISLFLNKSTVGKIDSTSFASQVVLNTGVHPWGTFVADIDGDGLLDIIVCNGADSTVSVFRNTSTPGNLSFASPVNFFTGYGTHDVIAADLNHDGKPDLVVTNYANGNSGEGTISILHNVSVGSTIAFTPHLDIPIPDGPRGIAVGDVDGDGWLDVAVASYEGQTITVFQNQGWFNADSVILVPMTYLSDNYSVDGVALTDIDGDGGADVVGVTSSNGVIMYRSGKSFGFESVALYHKGAGAGNVLGVDINGDGKPDVIAGNALETNVRVGSISILVNNSTGGTYNSTTLLDSVNLYLPSLAYTAAVADIDGDGRPDLIAPSYYTRTLTVLRSLVNDHYTITPTVVGPGTTNPAPAFTIWHGHDTTFTITANASNHIDSVVIDGVNMYALSSYTFKDVSANHTLKAYFSAGTDFAITSSTGPNGTISPLGTINVTPGANQTFTFIPNTGYGIDTVFVDGVKVASAPSYTFIAVSAPHTISVRFVAALTVLPLKVFLQGPATTGDTMQTTLSASGALAAHFGAVVPPLKTVDSISIEIRNAQTAAGSTTRKYRPAWLLKDGSILSFADTTKNYVAFDTLPGSYYIVVHHRNHLAIMSAAGVPVTSATPLYDFTTGQGQAFGTSPMVQVGTKFCLCEGDCDGSGVVDATDRSLAWNARNQVGYLGADCDLSGVVDATDRSITWNSRNKSSLVP